MPNRRGFTFVDVLAVIFIILLLVSLLPMTVRRTGCGAIVTRCLAQLRQIGTASVNYAADNNGSWPPYRGFRGYPIRIPTYPTTFGIAGLNDGAGGGYLDPTYGIVMMNVNPGTALPGARSFPWYETCNIGRLLQFGYLGNLNSAFDPALDSSSVFSGGTDSSQNWGANTQFYSSYIFNPHAAYIPSIDTQNASVIPATLPSSTGWPGSVPILYCPYPTVSTLPQDKCLAIDMVTNVSAMAHMSGSTVGDVNLVFGDAHAVTVPVPLQVIQFLQQISGNADLATWASKKHPPGMANAPFPNGMEWGIGPTTVTVAGATARPLPQPSGSPTPGQVYLDSYVDLLESLANGGDVVRLGANTQQGPASDQFWLWNGGAGRVTYTIPQ